MEKVVIFGTGVFAEVVWYYLTQDSRYEVVAFTETEPKDQKFHELPIINFDSLVDLYPPNEFSMFVSVGYSQMNQLREKYYHEAKDKGYKLINYIHPSVILWDNQSIGDNCFVFEDNTIQPFVRIGSNNIFWSGNHIGHHSSIGNHNFISSHVVVSGNVQIGNNNFMGVNSMTHDSIEIGNYNLIAAGAIIAKSIKDKVVLLPPKSKVFEKDSFEVGF